MKNVLIAIGVLVGIALAPLGLNVATNLIAGKMTTIASNPSAKEVQPPKTQEDLEQADPIKVQEVKKIITLETTNTVVLRGPVTGSSVAKAMKGLRDASRKVSKSTPLYLVLDTPGGSIVDGLDLIDFAKALPQKVQTVTLFAASMGFQIAQNLDTRYIVRNGTLMSHRARVEGLGGQVKGELETRYKMIRRSVDYLDFVASKRLGMSEKDYEKLIMQEYWVYGFDAVGAKAADEQVLVKCGESMDGSEVVEYQTFFGPVLVTFAQCPLIKEPEAIDFGKILGENKAATERAIKMSLTEKRQFVNEYVTTARFYEIFR